MLQPPLGALPQYLQRSRSWGQDRVTAAVGPAAQGAEAGALAGAEAPEAAAATAAVWSFTD